MAALAALGVFSAFWLRQWQKQQKQQKQQQKQQLQEEDKEQQQKQGKSCGLLARDFVATEGIAGQSPQIRVLQFNVLAKHLSSAPEFGGFTKSPRGALDYHGFRRARVLEEMTRFEPDIVTAQEVDNDEYEGYFCHEMAKRGYSSIHKPKAKGGRDGLAVFWKEDKVRFVSKRAVRYSTGSQVALICRFQLKNAPSFLVATTHLKAKPPNESVRVVQMQDLLAAINSERKSASEGVLLMGDFNSNPSGSVYSMVEASDLGLGNAYGPQQPSYTTWKWRSSGESKHTIDYIWHTPSILRLCSLLSVPTESAIPACRLPCWEYPSDHFAIGASFSFASSSPSPSSPSSPSSSSSSSSCLV